MVDILKGGSIVNIMSLEKGKFWKGKVDKVTSECGKDFFIINSIDNPGYAVVTNYDVEYRDGEFWQTRV